MDGSAFHCECAFNWTNDFACAAEYAEGCVWADFALAVWKQCAGDWANVKAVLAVGWAFFSVDIQDSVEYFAYSYCAFGAFDFAEAAAWALFFLDIDLYFQAILVGVAFQFLVGDLFSVPCE